MSGGRERGALGLTPSDRPFPGLTPPEPPCGAAFNGV